MDKNIAIVCIFGVALLCPCLVFAATGYASIMALGRNPSSAPKIFTAMIITLVFAEALAIILMLAAFQSFTSSANAV